MKLSFLSWWKWAAQSPNYGTDYDVLRFTNTPAALSKILCIPVAASCKVLHQLSFICRPEDENGKDFFSEQFEMIEDQCLRSCETNCWDLEETPISIKATTIQTSNLRGHCDNVKCSNGFPAWERSRHTLLARHSGRNQPYPDVQ